MNVCDVLGCFKEIEPGSDDYCAECDLLLCDECSVEHFCWDGLNEEG